MVPAVPMNFGRENIGQHDNLILQLQAGLQHSANSLILSYNSPVIARLTGELHLSSLNVEDFSESAVLCFIDAAYSGELVLLSRDNFRDVNKMCRAFEVRWMKRGAGSSLGPWLISWRANY